MLIKVFPSLIKRQKTHFHNLPCGASIILGNNGFIWISPVINAEEEHGGFTINLEDVSSAGNEDAKNVFFSVLLTI